MSEPVGLGSRIRWLGPTPAMVVWRWQVPCPLLESFARDYRRPQQPWAVYQALKPLAAISEADARQSLVDGWAVLLPDDQRVFGHVRDQPLAFRVDEATRAFGGMEAVAAACRACPANVPAYGDALSNVGPTNRGERQTGALAGCTQVLLLGKIQKFDRQTHALCHLPKPLQRPRPLGASDRFRGSEAEVVAKALFAAGRLRTLWSVSSPHHLWQRLWFRSSFGRAMLPAELEAWGADVVAAGLTQEARPEQEEPLTGWWAVSRAIRRVVELQADGKNCGSFEVDYVPSGFADGQFWWLSPHCGHCGAEMTESARQCEVCGRASGPVPSRKRQIMGWSPYRPIDSLLSPSQAAAVVAAATGQFQDND